MTTIEKWEQTTGFDSLFQKFRFRKGGILLYSVFFCFSDLSTVVNKNQCLAQSKSSGEIFQEAFCIFFPYDLF